MPIYSKFDARRWNESFPAATQESTQPRPDYRRWLMHPEGFDVDKLDVNEFDQGDGTIIAKIPRIEHRIYTRKAHRDSNGEYVDLVIGKSYDPESKQSRNKKVTIGTVIAWLPGMMIANSSYHDYFDKNGRLFNDPMKEEERKRQELKKKKEQERREPEEQQEKEEQQAREEPELREPEARHEETQTGTDGDCPQSSQTEEEMSEELKREKEELKRQRALLDERLKEVEQLKKQLENSQKELDHIRMVRLVQFETAEKNHIGLLERMLRRHEFTVDPLARKKPDAYMTLRQIRSVNNVLSELRNYFAGTDAAEYLELAEEPDYEDRENHPGTTYGEMAIILQAYLCTIDAYNSRQLSYADPEE